jgi:hypothetical protein
MGVLAAAGRGQSDAPSAIFGFIIILTDCRVNPRHAARRPRGTESGARSLDFGGRIGQGQRVPQNISICRFDASFPR